MRRSCRVRALENREKAQRYQMRFIAMLCRLTIGVSMLQSSAHEKIARENAQTQSQFNQIDNATAGESSNKFRKLLAHTAQSPPALR